MRLITALLLFFLCAFCTDQSANLVTVDPDAFEEVLHSDKAVHLIDVRTPEEYALGHIEGARNIDFRNEMFYHELGGLDRKATYLIYCQSGGRSGKVLRKMNQYAFKNVYNLDGGIEAWQAHQKPVVE